MALTIQDATGNDVTVTSIAFADIPPDSFQLGIAGFLPSTWYFDTDIPPDAQLFTFPARSTGSGAAAEAADPEGWE